jgi:C4-dicarboxylate transporter DctM subunit
VIVAIFIATYFALMILGETPLIFAISAAGFLVSLVFGAGVTGVDVTFIAKAVADAAFANNTGITIILFIIAGNIMSRGAITEKIFNLFAFFLGKCRGFMPILAILTCMVYGAISGSGPATTAAVGAMCYPVLVKLGYDRFFSASIIVVAGCLGMVIPPSVPVTQVNTFTNGLDLIVLYKLAAVVGVICGLLVCVFSYFYCRTTKAGDQDRINAWVDNLRSAGLSQVLKESIWAIMTPVLILGVIFSGIADTAQAAALSVVYGIFVSVCIYKTLKISDILPIVKSSITGSAGMLVMLAFVTMFANTLTKLNVHAVLTGLVNSMGLTPVALMLFIMVYQFIMGSAGAGSGVATVIPIAYPLMIATGLEPFTACMACVVMHAVGLCTPPVGLCLFVMTGMAKCEVTDIAKLVYAMVSLLILVALFLVFFPGVFAPITAGGYIPIP